MNWTEGNLARHSRGRQAKEVILRQKEYFAKARAGLLPSASRKSPPSTSISFLRQNSSPSPHHSRLSQNPRSLQTKILTGAGQDGTSTRKRSRDPPSPGNDVASLPVPSHHFKASPDGQQAASSTIPLDRDALHEKRRKLLLKGDWVGIGMQKPIPVKFSSKASESRKWSRHHRSAHSKTRHLLGSRYDQMKVKHEPMPTSTQARDVRIQIGSQEMRLGNQPSIIDPSRLSANLGTAPANSGFHDTGTLLESTSSRKFPEVAHQHGNIMCLMQQSVTDPREGRNASRHRVNQRRSSLTSISETSSDRPQKNTSRRKRKPPPIQHPVPQRSVHTRLLTLTSFSSDIADSNLAQVGQLNAPEPSGKEENELWRQWVAPSESLSTTDCSLPRIQETTPEPRISPGISEICRNLLAQTDTRDVTAGPRRVASSSCSERAVSTFNTHEHQPNSLLPIPKQPVNDWLGDHNLVSNPTDKSCQVQSDVESLQESLTFPQPLLESEYPLHSLGQSTSHSGEPALSAYGEGANQFQHTEYRDVSGENNVMVTEERETCSCEPLEPTPVETTQAAAVEKTAEEDPDAVWMKFVFSDDDSEKLLTAALHEGQGEPPRGLQLPDDDGSIDEHPLREWGCDVSTVGTVVCASNEPSDLHDCWASHKAAFGSSSTELTSDLKSDNREGEYKSSCDSVMVNPGTELGTPELHDRKGKHRTTWARMEPSEMMSEPGSLAVEASQSMADPDVGEGFRFARPKLFVGKLSDPTTVERPDRAINPVTMTKRKRGRPKKRNRDGRADIKGIPVYNGDPIEEFEESESEIQAEAAPSLFGALEME